MTREMADRAHLYKREMQKLEQRRRENVPLLAGWLLVAVSFLGVMLILKSL